MHGALNRIRFELRMRTHSNKALQAEWDRSGPDRYEFEIVELLKQRDDPGFDYTEELNMLEEIYREHYEQPAGSAGAARPRSLR